jgi:hypothetical protein
VDASCLGLLPKKYLESIKYQEVPTAVPSTKSRTRPSRLEQLPFELRERVYHYLDFSIAGKVWVRVTHRVYYNDGIGYYWVDELVQARIVEYTVHVHDNMIRDVVTHIELLDSKKKRLGMHTVRLEPVYCTLQNNRITG